MNPKHTAPTPASLGLSLADVYYIFFRHKWLIAILSVTALAAAILAFLLSPKRYQSEAKVLIKYVKETKPPEQALNDDKVTTPDARGENVISSEIEILTSMDLVNSVVEA